MSLKDALGNLLGPEKASRFDDGDLRQLMDAGYTELDDLLDANRDGLRDARLKPARADNIINAIVRRCAAASVGVGSAAGDGVAAGPGPGSAAAGGVAAGSGNTAAGEPAWGPGFNVMRLVKDSQTVGTVCWLRLDKGGDVLLTARHCFDPQPGAAIDMTGITVLGWPVKHVVSFPDHDLTVLQLENGQLLVEGLPFKLVGSVGLIPGMRITLRAYPLALDASVPGVLDSCEPTTSSGSVTWISPGADLATGDYQGTMPNSSGGAVVLSQTALAGLHLGTVWHDDRQEQLDATPSRDQQAGVGPEAAAASRGNEGAGGSTAGPLEVTSWSTTDSSSSPSLLLRCGSRKRKRPAGDLAPAVEQHAASQAAVEKLTAAVRYCMDNVQHKGSLGYFVPAHTLWRLLTCTSVQNLL